MVSFVIFAKSQLKMVFLFLYFMSQNRSTLIEYIIVFFIILRFFFLIENPAWFR